MKLLKFKWFYFAFSLLIILPGLFSLIRWGLRLSIDFTGGSVLVLKFIDNQKSKNQDGLFAAAQTADNITYTFRSHQITNDDKEKLKNQLISKYGKIEEKSFETVGPVIGKELTQKAFLAIIVASGAIVTYIAWSFRHVPKAYSAWKFGASAVVALLHDVLLVAGLFSLLGHFYHVEIDSLFITAMLTVIGFSVHDTIVVFDRIRENLNKFPNLSFVDIADFSLSETLVRSLNTSLTVIITLVALLLFGGESIRWFIVALLVGIVSGTYSSIFNATPILVLWESKSKKG